MQADNAHTVGRPPSPAIVTEIEAARNTAARNGAARNDAARNGAARNDAARNDAARDDAAGNSVPSRRYDRRPANENLDRPTLMWTTRESTPPVPDRDWKNLATVTGLLAIALGVGIVVGQQFGDDGSAAVSNDAPEVATPSTIRIDTMDSASSGVLAEESSSVNTEAPERADDTGSIVVQADQSTAGSGSEPATGQAGAFNPDDEASFLSELKAIGMERLSFVPGEKNLTPEGEEAFESITKVLMDYPNYPVEFRVGTYSEPTPGRNHGLSVHQAMVLQSKFAGSGVTADRLSVVGVGSHGVAQPAVASALFLDVSAFDDGNDLGSRWPLVFETPFTGTFDQESLDLLRDVSTARADSPLSLVGYSWSEATENANHDRSHELLDAAAASLVELGVPREQISDVGLGDVPVSLAERTTMVMVEAGTTAAVPVSLGAVPIDAVSFESGTVAPSEAGAETLAEVADLLIANPEVRVEVAVHFYGEKTSQKNHDASKLQADTIGAILTAHGVPKDQLEMVAHGDPSHFAAPDRLSAVTFTVIR